MTVCVSVCRSIWLGRLWIGGVVRAGWDRRTDMGDIHPSTEERGGGAGRVQAAPEGEEGEEGEGVCICVCESCVCICLDAVIWELRVSGLIRRIYVSTQRSNQQAAAEEAAEGEQGEQKKKKEKKVQVGG